MTSGGSYLPRVLAPERLTGTHELSSFDNGKHETLNDWLRTRALASEGLSARTYVACSERSKRVVAYYAIATAMEERLVLPNAKLRKGMPDQVPLLLIGRLAIDQTYQGRGLGTDMLVDALRRCLSVSEIVGARAIVTHAIDEDAVGFYQKHGFVTSPLGERSLIMSIETVQALLIT